MKQTDYVAQGRVNATLTFTFWGAGVSTISLTSIGAGRPTAIGLVSGPRGCERKTKKQNKTHIFNRAGADGDKHVRHVEVEVATHDRPLHLAVRLVALEVQRHPLEPNTHTRTYTHTQERTKGEKRSFTRRSRNQ